MAAAAATPLRPRAACASPSRTIDGHPCGENSMESRAGGLQGAGAGRAAVSCAPPSAPRPRPGGRPRGCEGEARARGAAPAPWPARPGRPARRGAQAEPGVGGRAWHTGAHPSRHCSCLPASFPEPGPFSSPHPHPRRGCLLSPAACASRSERAGSLGHTGDPELAPSLPKAKDSRTTQVAQKPRFVFIHKTSDGEERG